MKNKDRTGRNRQMSVLELALAGAGRRTGTVAALLRLRVFSLSKRVEMDVIRQTCDRRHVSASHSAHPSHGTHGTAVTCLSSHPCRMVFFQHTIFGNSLHTACWSMQ